MNRTALVLAASGLLGGALGSVAYQLGAARATVPPASSRLFYAGQLFDGASPLTGVHSVKVEFFDAATAGTSLCSTVEVNSSPTNGQFRVDASACGEELEAAADVFVQLVVDGDQLVPSTGGSRPRVAAVPYAAQADSAVKLTGTISATQVMTNGQSLAQRLDSTVQTAGSSERIERAQIGLPPDSCPITSQSGDWIASTLSPGTGFCRLTFKTGTFSAPPTCTCITGAPHNCALNTLSVTQVEYKMINGDTAAAVNDGAHIICMGPSGN